MSADILTPARPATPLPKAPKRDPLGAGGRWLVALCMLIGLVSHGWNMFRYPLYLTDEGIYMEQAWSVLREAKLSPYTYFYDHAPMGWLAIAGWVSVLPGQFQAFGNAINTGRVLMLIVHVASVFLMFEIVRRFSGSKPAAFLSTVVFNLSPLGVYYQRQVLLDNLMMFWILLGLYLLARKDGRIVTAMGAGTCFGLSLVTKENALFILPGCAYLLHRTLKEQSNRRFGVSFWWFAVLAPVTAYLLFAQIKNELFPQNFNFNLESATPGDHVSLLYTVWWQLHRNSNTGTGLSFSYLLRESWLFKDRYILVAGVAVTALCLLAGRRNKRLRGPMLACALMALGYGFYLTRSALLDFYIAPMVPLFALNLGMFFGWLTRRTKQAGAAVLVACLLVPVLVMPGGFMVKYNTKGELEFSDAYRLPLTRLQEQQVAWIKANVPTDARLIIDDDIWVALHDNNPPYRYAHSHYKATSDPDVRDKVFHMSWENIDYVVMSNKMRDALERGGETWIIEAIDQHGQTVWEATRGDVSLSIIKIGATS
ncbi:glycosyltransferase family 39 protein [Dactylosporangium roseum]|uniref:Glycosyltransferase family 39 protein n=1 Tax=Dactylosporangium roseum TaxID=47989 RepID=A0ABY5YZZ0_9ACTN|nr:glycosyltransferase family 39 protein [Dactylosporangium roseum]UWZ34969.1 glycosyltransferase family 39 protein [Dactylosporangium roseum]